MTITPWAYFMGYTVYIYLQWETTADLSSIGREECEHNHCGFYKAMNMQGHSGLLEW